MPFGGATVLERAVAAALGSGAGRTVVVLGHQAEAAQRVLARAWPDRPDLGVVVNPDYLSGQASSLRLGLQAVLTGPAPPLAVVFCLADQPLVTAATIRTLIDAYLAARAGTPGTLGESGEAPGERAGAGGPLVAAPVHAGRRGNPVLIDRVLFPELMLLSGDVGARAVLERYAGPATLLVPAGPEVLVDLDTPEDYARLTAHDA